MFRICSCYISSFFKLLSELPLWENLIPVISHSSSNSSNFIWTATPPLASNTTPILSPSAFLGYNLNGLLCTIFRTWWLGSLRRNLKRSWWCYWARLHRLLPGSCGTDLWPCLCVFSSYRRCKDAGSSQPVVLVWTLRRSFLNSLTFNTFRSQPIVVIMWVCCSVMFCYVLPNNSA